MERKQNHNSTIKHMITLTIILIAGIMLLWLAMIFVSVFMMIQSGLVKYFKEGDE